MRVVRGNIVHKTKKTFFFEKYFLLEYPIVFRKIFSCSTNSRKNKSTLCFVERIRFKNSYQTTDIPPERCKENIILSNNIFI